MAHGGGGGGGAGGSMGGIVPKTGHGTAVIGMVLAAGLVWLTVKHPKTMLGVVLASLPFMLMPAGVSIQSSWIFWLPIFVIGIAIGTRGNDEHNARANERGRALVQERNMAIAKERARLNTLRGYPNYGKASR